MATKVIVRIVRKERADQTHVLCLESIRQVEDTVCYQFPPSLQAQEHHVELFNLPQVRNAVRNVVRVGQFRNLTLTLNVECSDAQLSQNSNSSTVGTRATSPTGPSEPDKIRKRSSTNTAAYEPPCKKMPLALKDLTVASAGGFIRGRVQAKTELRSTSSGSNESKMFTFIIDDGTKEMTVLVVGPFAEAFHKSIEVKKCVSITYFKVRKTDPRFATRGSLELQLTKVHLTNPK